MKNIIIIVIAIIVFSTTVVKAQAPALTQEQRNEAMTIPQIITKFAQDYNLSSPMLTEIIFCESSFNPKANHDNNQGVGITGFHRDTFIGWEKESGLDLNYSSTFDQVKLMAWAFSKGESYRDDWSTWRKYKKYGTCKGK